MNQHTPYEITIAEKLGHLQVPDLREAIWKRIEDQLDLEFPADDQPGGPDKPQTPDWISITKRFGTFAVIVAVITTLFIINKKHPSEKNISPAQAPASIEQTFLPVDSTSAPLPRPVQQSPIRQQQPVTDNQDQTIPGRQDDALFIPSAGAADDKTPAGDSIPPQLSAPPPVSNNQASRQDSTGKKPRGFKGLKEDDYRISLKKDSTP
ncbi:MAG TPA: hypothetical protein VF145_13525 [Chitinophagaceae bacterium]